jgi:hypothetical protein
MTCAGRAIGSEGDGQRHRATRSSRLPGPIPSKNIAYRAGRGLTRLRLTRNAPLRQDAGLVHSSSKFTSARRASRTLDRRLQSARHAHPGRSWVELGIAGECSGSEIPRPSEIIFVVVVVVVVSMVDDDNDNDNERFRNICRAARGAQSVSGIRQRTTRAPATYPGAGPRPADKDLPRSRRIAPEARHAVPEAQVAIRHFRPPPTGLA